jgi:ATP-binding cassette, subfamily G (WHITE), member 2, SNQ2
VSARGSIFADWLLTITALFSGLVTSTSLSQQLQPVFLQLRNVYEARERPSKIYTWPVLITTAIIAEMPWNFIGGECEDCDVL